MRQITSFSGDYFFLSNMSPARVGIFSTLEHAYVAEKLGPAHVDEILKIESPYKAKRYGKKHPEVPGWKRDRVNVMRRLTLEKYDDLVLQQKLLDTEDAELIEGNTWNDTFWGQCPLGNGENNLGIILMETRDYYRFFG